MDHDLRPKDEAHDHAALHPWFCPLPALFPLRLYDSQPGWMETWISNVGAVSFT
jgi:hypothetical protein